MAKQSKAGPSETELIAWAIPKIAQGHYAFSDDSDGRELWVTEHPPDVADMEGELLAGQSETVQRAICRLREGCNFETIRDVFVLLFGDNLGNMLAQQFANTQTDYYLVLAYAYEQEKRLIKNIQKIFVRGREGLGSESLATLESKALPEAISVSLVSQYADEIARVFPKLIRRAEQLRVLATEETAPAEVEVYLQEASKCYIYGRFIACLIVCRSAIEFALRERFVKLGKNAQLAALQQNRQDSLANVISLARSVLPSRSQQTLDDADEVRRKAKDAVHKGPPLPEVCKEMFIKTRGILREFYSLPK